MNLTIEEKKARQRGYNRKWARANPEKVREGVRKWRNDNPEKVAEYDRKWLANKKAEELFFATLAMGQIDKGQIK